MAFCAEDLPTTLDPPFLAPIETQLNLPAPPSVNVTRRLNKAGLKILGRWKHQAGMHILATGGLRRHAKMPGKFEATLILDEHTCNLDLDNAAKAVIDYARQIGLIINDDKKHMRKVTIEWGHAAYGCRLILRSVA